MSLLLLGFAHGFSDEAPPSYQDLFQPPAPVLPQQHHQPPPLATVRSNNPQILQPRPEQHRIAQPQPVLAQQSVETTGCWCFSYCSNNPTIAGN